MGRRSQHLDTLSEMASAKTELAREPVSKNVATSGDVTRFRLFLISYAPLWLMLAFRSLQVHGRWHWSQRNWVAVGFLALAVVSYVDAHRLVNGARGTNPRTLYFDEIDDQGGNAAGYLATYLLPFLGLVPTGWGDWAAYAIYAGVAMIVFVRTDLTLVNPTLYLMGWRVVSAKAYLTSERTPEHQIWPAAVVVVCRNPAALVRGPVDVVGLGGCYVTKTEPTDE